MGPPAWLRRARDEAAWLRFLIPRYGVQWLGGRLPLAALRDRLPAPLAARLRQQLYGASIASRALPSALRSHRSWGDPPALDPARPVRYAAPPRASVLLVTYENLDLTRLCLASLQRAAGPLPFEVIIVDNGSRDGTPAYLRRVAESGLLPCRVLLNLRNEGFAAANNQAARLARGDVLVLLNNDTVVRPGWLEGLVAALDGDAGVGLVGPATNACGNGAEVGTPYGDLDEMEAFAARYAAAHTGERVELPMVALFCAALRRDLFERLGGLDERYGLGLFEDDDLAEAVRRAGLRVVLDRGVFVHHYGGAALSRLPPRRFLRLFWENRRRFEEKWRAPWQPR